LAIDTPKLKVELQNRNEPIHYL